MAQQPEKPAIHFEDVPLDEARGMGRGPRMEPMLYDTFKRQLKKLRAVEDHLVIEIRRLEQMELFSGERE
jgi:hypothetical protein